MKYLVDKAAGLTHNRRKQDMCMNKKMRIVIVGGVAGGASAAARTRRLSEDADIILFERGSYVSFANCGMPYHIGGTIPDRQRLLVQTPESLNKRFRIDVRVDTEVIKIDASGKKVFARNLKTGEETTESYDYLILSPGAEPIRPKITGVENERVFTLRSLKDMDDIKVYIDSKKPSSAVVIGAGYIGLEITEALAEKGIKVSLVELMNQVMGPADPEMAVLLNQQLFLHGVDLRLGASVTGIREGKDSLQVILSSGVILDCDFVMLTVGVKPDVKLARDGGLSIGKTGGILVDEHMRTSDPYIYAVGDAVEVTDFVSNNPSLIPLAGPANRQGRIAADNIFGRKTVYKKTQGTAICKVFGQTIGMTGLSEKVLKRIGMPFEKVYVHPASHATYYPGASPISLKLLFDPKTGKIFGAQAVGADGVDKRIDVISTAIRAGLTVFDLSELELAYAPPYGSAKDPVNYAGFVASNAIMGDVGLCSVEDILNLSENQVILDVRTPLEVEAGTVPGAINIPVDDLRKRMQELPKNKEILVTCQVGQRGYIACRILTQSGFRCRNLSGGYKTYSTFVSANREPEPVLLADQKEMHDDAGECGPVCIVNENNEAMKIVRTIDAAGLQCPGPIMRLGNELKDINEGEAVTITVTDPGFVADIPAWCNSTGNSLVNVAPFNGGYRATIMKTAGKPLANPSPGLSGRKQKTIVVFSDDFDRVMASFIIANGAASMGSDVTMFFTFWGLNVLRKPENVHAKKNFLESMFGMMMPRGSTKLGLSKLNMAGVGASLMKGIMKKKNVASLNELIGSALLSGVRLVACSMTMDIMGIKREELIDGIQEGGVASYLDRAEAGNVNLFI
jgi:NADPH-dependent 2,4-dienoyl-CoA reductase/sulfur reductase-like enzyme/peroxiredoxin family protein/rhodanese-related sulfurtransferase/TusA-related sulfurtransferase